MVRLVLGGRTARAPLREMLAATAGVEFVEADDMDAIIAETTRADALILSDPRGPDGARLAVALNGSGCRVKWVQMVSAGYDGIASHRLPTGLVLTNQGGVMAGSVAEHALALILALHRALPAAFDLQRAGRWEPERIRPTLRTLDGASVVIVGVGHVGGALATLLAPLGAHVVGVTRDGAMRDGFEQVYPIAALDDALALAEIVAICLPATAETRGLFSQRRIAAIKAGATLVNVGRGETVDAAALAAALSGGHLRGAGLDVTEPEPLPHDHPLWRAPNLIITPHVAGGGNPQSGRRIAAMVGENLSRFIAGEPLLNRVRADGA